MQTLSTFVIWELSLLLLGLSLLVTYQLLVDRINTNRLLFDGQDGAFSPGRLQLLVFTVVGGLWYVMQVAEHPGSLPEISQELLWILGGSNAAYLGGKGLPLLSLLRSGRERSGGTLTSKEVG